MLKIEFESTPSSSYNILCLGAHCDDIEIGCGGTILKLIETYPNLNIHWVVFSSTPERKQEALDSADIFLKKAAKRTIVIQNFRDGFLPYQGAEVKDYFEQLKQAFKPDAIFTHYRQDFHQDHRLISELTWNTFRNHFILEYEIPKYDGDLGNPNFFVHLSPAHYQQKIKFILDTFKTQKGKAWFTEELFQSILRIRGMESNAPSCYAEAFYSRKMVF
ncbi:PIG-L deacetylase family protein [Oscillatoria sp. FACHB-1406]|uniref:PIG-L deacetylase family protein n=1 Tax=Oscillatoria sp. FACHB-1406 TaxID=2692846 RepID=UPI001687243F|nr:PIG-L deacetylase family protein [Oscillatoria sp. FACHB-1406]MBD2580496.1 PIG-L family deacetylase [Oscillatoria sp. FACHB-1406]